MGDPLADALAARAAALLASANDATALFAVAMSAHARARDPFEEGRTLLLLGEHQRRERHRTAARASLTEAVRLFEHLGAEPWLARARNELRAAGGQAESGGELGVLTPQELAVARAVAAGGTNREIAQALYLSPRTVEYHLGSVYRKLGVHGRGALAGRLLAEEGAR
jgi:DNA-binding NarL/FixJ family response regulator